MAASLRARLALTFTLVVALSLVAAAGSLAALLRGYSERLARARLDDVAIVVTIQARAMLMRGETPSQVLDFLAEQADRLELRILLVDRRGVVVRETGEGPSLRGEQIPVEAAEAPRLGRPPLFGRFSGPGGGVYEFSAVSLPALPQRAGDAALLVVAQAVGSPLTTLRPLLSRLAIAAGAGLLAGLIAAMLLARWLGRPLGELLAATQAMTRGDYSRRVRPAGPSELSRLSESFNSMAEEVERSRGLVRRFVSTLSHELRTPLTSIRGFAQAVLDGSARSPEEIQRAMRIVDRESRRLQRLAAELLDLSRLQAGQVPMRRDRLDLAALLRHCAEVLELRAGERQVTLAVHLPDELSITGDADRLEQVFTNLLDNAVKFTPNGAAIRVDACRTASAPEATGGARARSRARRPAVSPPPRQYAVVDVANPGEPIPAAELPSIFEQFYTGHEGRERGGVGLGLPIAREIVRAHGGEITVVSDTTLTTFRVALPVD